MSLAYLSVCSGIEAATAAWHPLGWQPWAFAEVDTFPSAVLAHHYPDVPNLGDMTRFQEWPDAAVDVLVGGTPCQSFSVAGLRAGLDDPRGSLMLVYLAIARRYRPRWVVWENVPGVLSSDDGRAFGTFLRGLADLGYGFAYRVLDAQHFGLAQRRRRVFVVGHLGNWRRAAAVLFERASLSGHPAPRREAGQSAPTLPSRRTAGGGLGTDFDCDGGLIAAAVAGTLGAHSSFGRSFGSHPITDSLIAHSLRADGFDASEDGTGRGTPLVAETLNSYAGRNQIEATYIPFDTTQITSPANYSHPQPGDPCHPLAAGAHPPAVAFEPRYYTRDNKTGGAPSDTAALTATAWKAGDAAPHVATSMQVRRLTPRECERLQGFPDDYTLIPYRGKPAADGPRYKALGNSMAVPCMAWIGRRIQSVQEIRRWPNRDTRRAVERGMSPLTPAQRSLVQALIEQRMRTADTRAVLRSEGRSVDYAATTAALVALLAATEPPWQDIATAPKDGRDVLVYDEGAILIASFLDKGDYDDDEPGWYEANGLLDPPPQFWCALPAPPEKGK